MDEFAALNVQGFSQKLAVLVMVLVVIVTFQYVVGEMVLSVPYNTELDLLIMRCFTPTRFSHGSLHVRRHCKALTIIHNVHGVSGASHALCFIGSYLILLEGTQIH